MKLSRDSFNSWLIASMAQIAPISVCTPAEAGTFTLVNNLVKSSAWCSSRFSSLVPTKQQPSSKTPEPCSSN
jgi:hypothetical protein